jgi:hypothetical protein
VNITPLDANHLPSRTTQVEPAGQRVPDAVSARLESLDDRQVRGSGLSDFVINGQASAIALDGMYMRHVIVRDADIRYDGGPLQLDDVYFVNCTFGSRFQLNRNSVSAVNLGRHILKKTSVKFLAKGVKAKGKKTSGSSS